jgi:hypothetical protein
LAPCEQRDKERERGYVDYRDDIKYRELNGTVYRYVYQLTYMLKRILKSRRILYPSEKSSEYCLGSWCTTVHAHGRG